MRWKAVIASMVAAICLGATAPLAGASEVPNLYFTYGEEPAMSLAPGDAVAFHLPSTAIAIDIEPAGGGTDGWCHESAGELLGSDKTNNSKNDRFLITRETGALISDSCHSNAPSLGETMQFSLLPAPGGIGTISLKSTGLSPSYLAVSPTLVAPPKSHDRIRLAYSGGETCYYALSKIGGLVEFYKDPITGDQYLNVDLRSYSTVFAENPLKLEKAASGAQCEPAVRLTLFFASETYGSQLLEAAL